ncbi:iron-sulfur cluster co-chaperone protein HscB-like isoform X2 [Oscarella lobularis]|uniref:iron-sulfur cluster co-chaperone protein HscB-like isoform X2 n=1 Tax=Oscarella lobularis TaxID=121494 RepID=UPI003313E406
MIVFRRFLVAFPLLRRQRRYAANVSKCWKCGDDLDSGALFFCGCARNVVLPSSKRDFFSIFEIPQSMNIDEKMLARKFRELQSKLHPDKFAQKSKTEQQYSLQQSSLVNEGYKTLLNRLSRGFYLLEMRGFTVPDDDHVMEKEFLSEVMEFNEQLEEIENDDHLRETSQLIEDKLTHCWVTSKENYERGNFKETHSWLTKMKYYVNLQQTIKDRLRPS